MTSEEKTSTSILEKKSEKKGKWKYVFSDSFYNLVKSNDS